jgi:arginyl-tRNA synthetase
MVAYALELAQSFTAFYRDCQIVGSDEQPFRLALSDAAQSVLARSLDLLGVSAPKEM